METRNNLITAINTCMTDSNTIPGSILDFKNHSVQCTLHVFTHTEQYNLQVINDLPQLLGIDHKTHIDWLTKHIEENIQHFVTLSQHERFVSYDSSTLQ